MFFLVDKPLHTTSGQVLAKVKRKFWLKKAWFVGTLDPLATGCLLVATGHSTKLIPLLEKKDKTYVFTVDVTRTSDSLDLGMPTTILSEREIHTLQDKWNPEEISSICQDFIGTIEQTPPIYSAIRLEGKRAYDLARKWESPSIPTRKVQIHSLMVLYVQFPLITLEARVGSGTYIRTLGRDIGSRLGGLGVITELRRTSIAPIDGISPTPLEEIDLWCTMSERILFPEMPFFELSEQDYTRAKNGLAIIGDLADGLAIGMYKGQPAGLFSVKDRVLSIKKFGIS